MRAGSSLSRSQREAAIAWFEEGFLDRRHQGMTHGVFGFTLRACIILKPPISPQKNDVYNSVDDVETDVDVTQVGSITGNIYLRPTSPPDQGT